MLAFFLTTILSTKRSKRYLKKAIVVVFVVAVLMNNPFIYSGDFGGQVQKYQLSPNNLSVIDRYLNSSEDYRVLYLPMVQPFKFENLTYNGVDPIIAYSSKPDIGNYMQSDFQNRIGISFCIPSSNLTNILNILSIKYVFLRNDTQSVLPEYTPAGELQLSNGSYDIRPIWKNDNLFKTLQNQQTLILSENSSGLMVFENKYYLPHVYSATTPIAVDGGMDAYFASLQTENINNKDSAAIFLSQQLSQGQWQFIENYKNSSLNYAKTQSYSPVLTFNAVNPTKYEVHVENATGPFFLVFNENFDSQWKAYIRDLNNNPEGGSIPEEKHSWLTDMPMHGTLTLNN